MADFGGYRARRNERRDDLAAVDPLDLEGKRYPVCARGNSNWVRNARSAAEIVLARSMRRSRYAVSELAPSARPPVLKAILTASPARFSASSPSERITAEAFNDVAPRYPVFELQPLDETADASGVATR